MLHEIKNRFRDDQDFKRIYWLTGIKKTKYDMDYHHKRYLQCKDGKFVNTDGAQLREITIDLPNGFYEVVSRKK